jgi:TRAP transporter TAXI family solute receptor
MIAAFRTTCFTSVILLAAGLSSAAQAQSSSTENPAAADWSRGQPQLVQPAQQQQQTPVRQQPQSTQDSIYRRLAGQANANTVSIISGNPNGTYLSIAYDISAVLDDSKAVRVLPMVGRGGVQNVRDVLFLRGVDLGIMSSNTLSYLKTEDKTLPNIDGKLVYITRLFNEEIHIYARKDIKSLKDLNGKKVNFSDIGSGTQATAAQIFKASEVKPQQVNMGQADAMEAMRRNEIAATVLEAGKPSAFFSELAGSNDFHFVPVEYVPGLQGELFPTELTHEDYPRLIPEGQSVETVATAAVLVAYNWPSDSDRYQRIATFTNEFFGKLAELRKAPRHPKWSEVNFLAEVPNMKRFEPAQKWLDANMPKPAPSPTPTPVTEDDRLKAEFNGFLSSAQKAGTDEAERQKLFNDFVEWRRSQAPSGQDGRKKD